MFFPLAIYGRLKILSYLCTRLKAFFVYCKIQKRAEVRSFPYCYLSLLSRLEIIGPEKARI